jgi:hypothetical protein
MIETRDPSSAFLLLAMEHGRMTTSGTPSALSGWKSLRHRLKLHINKEGEFDRDLA